MFNHIQGDLLAIAALNETDAIAHGVNCRGVMGAGIAKIIREHFPGILDQYRALCAQFGPSMVGQAQFYVPTDDLEPATGVFNLYTQIEPGPNAEYSYLYQSLLSMRLQAELLGLSQVHLPEIGSGIGGLAKHNVEHFMHQILEPSEVSFTLVHLPH